MEPGPSSMSFTYSPALSPFTVTVQEYLRLHPEYEGIAAGAIVFDNQDRVLIVQRAAHDSNPNLWEVPGGACDFTDESILHGLVREVWEESRFKVTALTHVGGPGDGGVVFLTATKKLRICKFTFVAEVESTDAVTLDPSEHQDYLWVTEEECESERAQKNGVTIEFKFTSSAQKATILEGFASRKEAKATGP